MSAALRLTIEELLSSSAENLLGHLVRAGASGVERPQLDAWSEQLVDLRDAMTSLCELRPDARRWSLLLEYHIPIIGRRPDAVLLADDLIYVLEYKAGTTTAAPAALRQARGYALDLDDFHEESRGRTIVALVVGRLRGARAATAAEVILHPREGAVVAPEDLGRLIHEVHDGLPHPLRPIDPAAWDTSRYFAVPTIIEAARAIYEKHDVREISHSRAGTENLQVTLERLLEAVKAARAKEERILCLVTGVPGSGKTLAGLNAISVLLRELDLSADQAAFLSGNTPLIEILKQALKRSVRGQRRGQGGGRAIDAMIQKMHAFVADAHGDAAPPAHRVIVFDEAQRAWSAEKNAKKFGRALSEADLVLDIMGRHRGWAVVIGLVGGGQEIHAGEAGLGSWGEAVLRHPEWRVWTSPEALRGGPSVAGATLFEGGGVPAAASVREVDGFHLAIPKRSYEAESNAAWVNAVLQGKDREARALATPDFPVLITRDLGALRGWLKRTTRAPRRCGLVASSGAARLRAWGVEVPSFKFLSGIDYPRWFLAEEGDVRSSNQLEVAMSEFELQGLELDVVGLLWGGDLLFPHGTPQVRRFKGTRWELVRAREGSADTERLTINKYRVLMTRYRKGMAIWVPKGISGDHTCDEGELRTVFDHLIACGARALEAPA